MSDTVGLIIGGAAVACAECAGIFFLARFTARRMFAASKPVYPPCVDCGQSTESPRLDRCDRCDARAVVALFDMHVAEIKARHAVPGLRPSDGS